MTPTERRYAQIEALAFTWACERLSDYLVGLQFHIQTDHKPLVPLFSSKHLEELPLRVQRFRMRMMRFQFTIGHVPGKELRLQTHFHELRSPKHRQQTNSSSVKPQISSTLWWNIFLPPSNDCRKSESASRRTQCVKNSPSCASLAGLRRVPSQQMSSRIPLSHLNSLWSTAFYYGSSFRHHYEKSCWTGYIVDTRESRSAGSWPDSQSGGLDLQRGWRS